MKAMVINIKIINFVSLFLLIFILPFSSAIFINELELNPTGSDSGYEYVELYSDTQFDLSGYYLENNDNQTYNLNGSFSGIYVVQFTSQWLDNSDEKVALKKANQTMDETSVLEDSKNDVLSWSKCSSKWEFIDSTKGSSNLCPAPSSASTSTPSNSSTSPNTTTSSTTSNSSSQSASSSSNSSSSNLSASSTSSNSNVPSASINQEAITAKTTASSESSNDKITLNSVQKQDTEFLTSKAKMHLWIAYSFSALCIFIIILLLIKNR